MKKPKIPAIDEAAEKKRMREVRTAMGVKEDPIGKPFESDLDKAVLCVFDVTPPTPDYDQFRYD